AAADRVLGERAEVEAADRGGAGGHRVGHRVEGALRALPHIVAAAADADVAGDLGAERLNGAVVVQPDHQLGAVGLPGGGGRLVEPDVVRDVVGAGAGLAGAPAGGDLAAAGQAGGLDRGRGQAAGGAGAPVAALVDGRVAAGRAVGRVVDRRVGDREAGAA